VFLLDISGSMSVDGKIQALNQAIRESIPQMRSAARDNPNAQLLVRALTFSAEHAGMADPTPASERPGSISTPADTPTWARHCGCWGRTDRFGDARTIDSSGSGARHRWLPHR
jgi:hypothetical protein